MSDPHPADELAKLQHFLARLESDELKLLRQNGVDETARGIEALKREIAHLEKVLARPTQRNGG